MRAYAQALNEGGHWAVVVDDAWRLVYVTDEYRLTLGAHIRLVRFDIGERFFGEKLVGLSREWQYGLTDETTWANLLSAMGGLVLADLPGAGTSSRTWWRLRCERSPRSSTRSMPSRPRRVPRVKEA